MKQLLKLSFPAFCLALLSCGSADNPSDARAAKEATGAAAPAITTNHIQVPLSDFYMIPPQGFNVDASIQMLKKEGKAGVYDYEANFIPMTIFAGSPVEKYMADNKAASQKEFPGVWQEETVTVSGTPAVLCRYQVMKGVKVYHLYFKDKWKEKSLIANYDEKDNETGEAMKAALKTVVIR